MKYNVSDVVKYINDNINDNSNKIICNLLTEYLHSRYCYIKRNPDGTYFTMQPGFPDEIVVSFNYYSDPWLPEKHKINRLMLHFDNGTEYDISIHKFKRYCREFYKYNKFNT